MKFLKVLFFSAIFVFSLYGFNSITKLGLYSDDWERIHLYHYFGSPGLIDKVKVMMEYQPTAVYRITQFFIYPFSAFVGDLINNQILAMHLLSYVLNLLTFVSLYYLVAKFTKSSVLTFIYACLIFTYPGRSSTFYWGSTQTLMVSILFMLLALNFHFYEITKKWVGALLIFISTLISFWSYEVTLFLPLIYLSFFLVFRERKALLNFISSGFAIAVVLFYKFYAYSHIFHLQDIKKLNESENQGEYGLRAFTIFKQYIDTLGYSSLFRYWSGALGNNLLVWIIGIALIILFIILIKNTRPVFEKPFLGLFIIAILLILGPVIVYTPVYELGSSFLIFGRYSRFTTVAALGFGLLTVLMLHTFIYTENRFKNFFYVLLFIFLGMNLFVLNKERLSYLKSWQLQQNVLNKLDFSDLQKNSPIFVFVSAPYSLQETDNLVPVFSDFWSISYALSLRSGNPYVEADFHRKPLGKLDEKGGYTSKNWRKINYPNENIYYLDLGLKNPEFISVSILNK